MTTRQIRIACDGFVISTRPIFDPIDANDITLHTRVHPFRCCRAVGLRPRDRLD